MDTVGIGYVGHIPHTLELDLLHDEEDARIKRILCRIALDEAIPAFVDTTHP